MSEEHALTDIAAKYEILPAHITRWKSEFLKNAPGAFSNDEVDNDDLKKEYESEIDELHRQLGQLNVKNN